MDELELSKYMNWMEREYGPEWKDVLNDQLRTNQLGDNLPSNMGLLNSREEIDQVLGSKLVDNPEYPHIKMTPTHESMMSIDGVPRGPQLMSEWGQTSDPYAFHTQDSLQDYISENFPDTDTSLGLPSTVKAPQYQDPEMYASGDKWGSLFQTQDSLSPYIDSTYPSATSSASPALALETGPSGYASLSASGAESALPYAGEGISEGLAAETAAESGTSAWGGPQTFAANMAVNMIPTRDRDKVDTPIGDEGSQSGILKGGAKGALLGGTIGSSFGPAGTAWGAAIGGGLGVLGGAQGYFDSTSAPQIQIGRVKRGGGMPQGLLGGGSMYG
jgi:hypothetical protein